MADVELSVVFRDADSKKFRPTHETLRPGEQIAGEILVKAHGDYSCGRLGIDLMWRTTGKGFEDWEVARTTTHDDLKWRNKDEASYPFAFEMPARPFSYSGELFDIEWVVRAEADIPWTVDPTTYSEALELLPSATSGSVGDHHDGASTELAGVPKKSLELMQKKVNGRRIDYLFLAALAAYTGFLVVTENYKFVIVFALAFVLAVVGVFRKRVAERRFGQISPAVDPSSASAGDTVTLSLAIASEHDLVWDHLTIDLVAREVAREGIGTNSTTHRHEISRTNIVDERSVSVTGGHLSYPIVLPEEAALSFTAEHHTVEWIADIKIAAPEQSDFAATAAIEVVPS